MISGRCPFAVPSSMLGELRANCMKEECALWCNEDGCAFKKIAIELTKLVEAKGE